MKGGLAVWADLFRSVGRALLELLGAEYAELSEDLKGTAGRFGRVLALVAAALFICFWMMGVAAYAAVELAAQVMPRWGAALAVTGVLALGVVILGLMVRSRLRRLEPPAATLRRRFEEHAEWWRRQVLEEGRPGAGDEEAP